MVEKFKLILEQIKREKGEVALFALVKMDEYTEKWTVILSSRWINPTVSTDIFNYLRNLILTRLSEEERMTIGRIGLFEVNNHLVSIITHSISAQDSVVSLKDTQINGYTIHDAYIFESRPLDIVA